MILEIKDDFDPRLIAESGQCFRWNKTGVGKYRLIATDKCLNIENVIDNIYNLDCDENEYNSFWADYLDMSESYAFIRERINDFGDEFLMKAAKAEKGIRILRQDPWEMIISFIISQNRNINAIKKSIELLCEFCGEKLKDSFGNEYYAFPKPKEILSLTDEQLIECKLGYRDKYVRRAAEDVCEGVVDIEALKLLDDEGLFKSLVSMYGIGKKVASCVALFGFHRMNFFPEDVWIKRVLKEQYQNGYPFERYSPYNGVYQQYMFDYYRN